MSANPPNEEAHTAAAGAEETTDRRVRKSKAALKETLIRLMRQREFKHISITDLVRGADLNRGTFYKHYQTKEELLAEAVDDAINDLVDSFRAPYRNAESFAVSELSASAVTIFEHVHRHAAFYTLIVESQALPGFPDRICGVIKGLTLHDLSGEHFNPRIDRELYAGYQSYAIWGMILGWIRGGFAHSPVYMAEQLLEFVRSAPADVVFRSGGSGERKL
ncbi:TetR/AcrR family transcriptional regulator C-terminal domain-containing protein [Saccharibacillus sp. CPCC 101409]|uniref:TetR/AcrR family transcriptional regulator n=1 Tax=Saccharibacillus sp. CPCC 101409 TaxID=3058041 RepID=UPI002672E567|nr:TetR/AcrR family transcriptional regulator [Saccharibacillus sp. CPCC 101409]MDO3413002.1 TetR/AcrR family transcriptional regulator C-terminal domain-containing protein [Saccharibacillus sp. CPCC 101409]